MLMYFIIGIAVIVLWVLFKRLITLGIFLVAAGAFYFFVTNNQPNPTNGILNLVNTNKLEEVKNMVGQEAQTVLSFYSALSRNQGNLTDQLEMLSNNGGGVSQNNQTIQSKINELVPNKTKEIIGKVSYFDPRKEALLFAVSKGQVKVAEMLIKNQSNINVKDKYGRTPLIIAVINYDTKMAEMLLINYADINVEDNNGNTALMYATLMGNSEVFKLMMDKYSSQISKKSKQGSLILAAKLGRTEMVKALIKDHSNINAKDAKGETALMHAAFRGYTEIVQLLVGGNADVNAQDNKGRTALMLAKKKNRTEVIKILQKAGK